MSGIFWHAIVFSAVLAFLAASTYRFFALTSLAPHLRWELAPIPGEKGGRYGGSHLEESAWWRKPPKRQKLPEIGYMMREIILMRGIWKANRTLHPFSVLLHGGIYLSAISLILHVINAIMLSGGLIEIRAGWEHAARIAAITGYTAGTLGALALILKRVLDDNYRTFTNPALYFKLSFLLVIFASGLGACLAHASFPREIAAFIRDLITLNSAISASPLLAAHLITVSLFVIYLPFTDMFHFLAKYFTYHAVRWDNATMDRSSTQKLATALSQPISWTAPHIAGKGKSWQETIMRSDEESTTS